MDRRDFLQTTMGVTFAAAVMPSLAENPVVTNTDGLLADVIKIESGGQSIPVYRAQPRGGKNLPVVLVISEIFGVHAHIADVVRRFAKQGYLASDGLDFIEFKGSKIAISEVIDVKITSQLIFIKNIRIFGKYKSINIKSHFVQEDAELIVSLIKMEANLL